MADYDGVVVGAANAAMAAPVSAGEHGAGRVVRTDPQLAGILVERSYDTVRWMARQGIVMEAAVSLSGITSATRLVQGARGRVTGGGVKVNDRAQVHSTSGTSIPGLFAAGA